MKPGDFYHKMKPTDRLRGVANRKYDMREVYSSPDEVVADLKIMFAQFDISESNTYDMKNQLSRLKNARIEIEQEIAAAFKKWQFAYGTSDQCQTTAT